jgi:hypothetical protein
LLKGYFSSDKTYLIQLKKLFDLFKKAPVIKWLNEGVSWTTLSSLSDQACQVLGNPGVIQSIQKGHLTVQAAGQLSNEQVNALNEPKTRQLVQAGILTWEQGLDLTYSNTPTWSLGFAIQSGLFESGLIATWEEACAISPKDWAVYCHPVLKALQKSKLVTKDRLTKLSPQECEKLEVGTQTLSNKSFYYKNIVLKILSDTKIQNLMSLSKKLSFDNILAQPEKTLYRWALIIECDVLYDALSQGELELLQDSALDKFTWAHKDLLNSNNINIKQLGLDWRFFLPLTYEQAQKAYSSFDLVSVLSQAIVKQLIKEKLLTIPRILEGITHKSLAQLEPLLQSTEQDTVLNWFNNNKQTTPYSSTLERFSSWGSQSSPEMGLDVKLEKGGRTLSAQDREKIARFSYPLSSMLNKVPRAITYLATHTEISLEEPNLWQVFKNLTWAPIRELVNDFAALPIEQVLELDDRKCREIVSRIVSKKENPKNIFEELTQATSTDTNRMMLGM